MAAVSLANPYVGPRSFLPGERLYGRDRDLNDLYGLLVAERIVLMHSPSGAGKTSLIQAALIPRLHDADFVVLPIARVGLEPPAGYEGVKNRYTLSTILSLADEQEADPANLAGMSLESFFAAYDKRHGKNDTLLIFDQFEEVLTADPLNQAAKQEFFTQLGKVLRDKRRWALFAMREDYVASLSPYVRYVPTRFGNTYRLDLLNVNGAQAAVRQPAEHAGVAFDAEAAAALVDDLRRSQVQRHDGTIEEQLGPGIEPVQLQVVCYRLWQRLFPADQPAPPEPKIHAADLQQVGDVDGSLAEYYAERVIAAAAETGIDERTIRTWVDRRLITPLGVRSQVLRGIDSSEGLPNQAIDLLMRAYLVRAEQRRGMVWFELAHDRLIAPVRQDNQGWFERTLSVLQRRADLWELQSRPDSLLLRDADLAEAEAWLAGYNGTLNEVEAAFLARCRELRAAVERERRQNQRIKILAWVASAVAVIALVSLAVAINQYLNVVREQRIGNARRLAASASRELVSDPELSVFLARAAVQATANHNLPVEPSATQALYQAVGQSRIRATFTYSDTFYVVAASPDGTWLAGAGDNGVIILRNLADGSTRELSGHEGLIYDLDFSGDSTKLASSSFIDNTVRVWDVAGNNEPIVLSHPIGVNAVALSADGSMAASASDDQIVRLWDVATATERSFDSMQGAVYTVELTADGSLLAAGDNTGLLRIIRTADGTTLAERQFQNTVYSVAFDPAGTRVALTDASITPQIWDWNADTTIPLSGHTATGAFVDFSPQGDLVATSSEDRTIRIWDASDGDPLLILNGKHTSPFQVAFRADGQHLFNAADQALVEWDLRGSLRSPLLVLQRSSAGDLVVGGDGEGRVYLFDAADGALIGTLEVGSGQIDAIDLSGDGRFMAVSETGGQVSLWDLAARQAILTIQAAERVRAVALNADGSRLAYGDELTVHVLDQSGAELWRTDFALPVTGLDFGVDGATLAVVEQQGDLILLDDTTGSEMARSSTEAFNYGVAFSPDGRFLTAFNNDGKAFILNGDTLSPAEWQPPAGESTFSLAAFSPDGSRLALTGRSGQVVVLNTTDGSIVMTIVDPKDLNALAMTGDDALFVGDVEGEFRRYPLRFDELLSVAEQLITRPLTAEECEQNFNDQVNCVQ